LPFIDTAIIMFNKEFYGQLKPYTTRYKKKSFLQLFDSVVPYFLIVALMSWLLVHGVSYFIVFPLAILAAGFMVRIFIVFHDCVHGSFSGSQLECSILGHICGIITFTAYYPWQHSHILHHMSSSNLQKRGDGDVWMMTLDEYNESSFTKRLIYRLYRNPVFLFVVVPVFKFFILNRIPESYKWNKYLFSQMITTSGIVLIAVGASFVIGFTNYLLIQVPIMAIGGGTGLWLFYIQHQFEDSFWTKTSEWNPVEASMQGSSYYKLPGLLRWFTGNIGFHHIHHLLPNIPNYNLQKCYNEVEDMRHATTITFWRSFRAMALKLYDEKSQRLVSFRTSRKLMKNYS
jgi:acyl-lipid omega-6 desaturase (Delta-12 desaturase)